MYTWNGNAAKQGDERAGRILEIGPFIGKFRRAEDVVSSKTKTKGVEFVFESDDKQSAQFTLWTINAEGKELMGFRQLQAVMTILKCRALTTKTAMVKKFDRNSGGVVDVEADVFLDLMDKPVGVLFETEDYHKTGGGLGTKVVFAGCFDPVTRLTASEIIDKKVVPAKLESHIKTLRHRPAKAQSNGGNGGGNMGHPNAPGNGGGGFEDDDIPFGPLLSRAAWSAI